MAIGSAVLCVINGAIYVRGVARGVYKPHMFSWIIWGLLMLIAAAAQYSDKAGVGAWATVFGGASCFVIVVQAAFLGEKNITPGDWAAFLSALAAIPLWVATGDPLGAVVLVTVIDGIGYYPTWRKARLKPHQEAASVFLLSGVMCLMRLFAVEHYSLTTALYPAALAAMNFVLSGALLVWRRRALDRTVDPEPSSPTPRL